MTTRRSSLGKSGVLEVEPDAIATHAKRKVEASRLAIGGVQVCNDRIVWHGSSSMSWPSSTAVAPRDRKTSHFPPPEVGSRGKPPSRAWTLVGLAGEICLLLDICSKREPTGVVSAVNHHI